MAISRPLISHFLNLIGPEAVQARLQRWFHRKHFFAAGMNDVYVQDQHDKWLHFRLWFHNSLNLYTGYNNWMKVWWTNKNLWLIAGLLLALLVDFGGL
jgi:hypothetical protein